LLTQPVPEQENSSVEDGAAVVVTLVTLVAEA
jgi:hypothetical protein